TAVHKREVLNDPTIRRQRPDNSKLILDGFLAILVDQGVAEKSDQALIFRLWFFAHLAAFCGIQFVWADLGVTIPRNHLFSLIPLELKRYSVIVNARMGPTTPPGV